MTVSRVVRGIKAVQPETEKKVCEAIARLGYKPDPALSALAVYRSQGSQSGDGSTLIFLDCDGSAFSEKVLAGVRKEALLYGYLVERHPMPETADGQRRLNRRFYHRGVKGLLFGPSDAEREFGNWDWSAYAAVSLGALSHKPELHSVASDYFHAAYSGTSLLRREGARRIGFVVEAALEGRTAHRWFGGYAAAQRDSRLYVYSNSAGDSGVFRDWVERNKIDGIVTIHGDLAPFWSGPSSRFLLLNSTATAVGRDHAHLSLDPDEVGEEGVRFLHHLLLRREYGLPKAPRMLGLRGVWKMPCPAGPTQGGARDFVERRCGFACGPLHQRRVAPR